MTKTPRAKAAHPARDLFGEIPISTREVELWLYSVPRMPYFDRHRVSYTRGYDVAGKIARAKLRGDLDELLVEICEFCGQALASELAPAPCNTWPEGSALKAELNTLRRRIFVLQLILRSPTMKGVTA